ncbi:hypothetical protein AYO41_00940 [Verrucomicrobia bacterium SCGC AG-212-E04]|nr:hypothetical protein AYO41_00940 [Verrucomicrobia bacterium SCGC AG-212-E04]
MTPKLRIHFGMTKLLALLRALFAAPAQFPREQQRFVVLIAVAAAVAAPVHAGFVTLFFWMGMPPLALYNILSVLIWVAMPPLARRGFVYLPATLVAAEVAIHCALCTFFIGWNCGAAFMLLLFGPFVFGFPFHRWYRVLWIVVVSTEFALLFHFGPAVAWTGPSWVLAVLTVQNIAAVLGLGFLLAGYQSALVAQAERALESEHARSEALLHNILPPVIAERLKGGGIIADTFPEASVLFADIADFTPTSQSMTAAEVVQMLDELFSRMDALVHERGLEKIKTIGDAYMIAAGVPVHRADHAEAIVAFALELTRLMADYNRDTGRALRLRIGINSGPVVAGVIGRLRFLYDLWGDCVNTAARMESHGLPGEIQITEATYRLVRDKYTATERGVIDVKGKGPMRVYLLQAESGGSAAG